jgi:hypothetical protein
VPKRPLKSLTKLNPRDPLQDLIDRQLSSQPWNPCVCIEEEILAAIDEKHCCSHQVKVIHSLKKEGLTLQDISKKTGLCKRQIKRILKKIKK